MTIFYHKHAANYSFCKGPLTIKFAGGNLRTEDSEVIKAVRNNPLFGNQEDGAVIYEVANVKEHITETHRKSQGNVNINTPPPVFKQMDFQPLYAINNWFVCSICGLKHGNVNGLTDHIKKIHGEDVFANMDLKKTAPVQRPFVPGSAEKPVTEPADSLM
jgi:hypothetical protein